MRFPSLTCAAVVASLALTITGCKRGSDSADTDAPQPNGSGAIQTPTNATQSHAPEPPAPKPTPQMPHQPETPLKDPKVVAFEAGMKNFIDEAKSLTRAMDLLPEQASYRKRIEDVQEAYSRIPDPPASDDVLTLCRKSARQLTVNFEAGSLYLKFINDFLRLNSKEGADKSANQFRDLAAKQKADLDELEAAVNDHRLPNIELSDVIKGKD